MKELSRDASQDGPDLVITRSNIPPPAPVQNLSTILIHDGLMKGGYKTQVYELFRDRIITPRGFDGVQYLNYYTKVAWSPLPFTSGPSERPKCVLAALTSNFHMVIYSHSRRAKAVEDVDGTKSSEWSMLLDISKIYNGVKYHKWLLAGEKLSGLMFDEYKSRMYELTITDFCWITVDEVSHGPGIMSEAFLMTAHANGDINIWWVVASPDSGQLTAEQVFVRNVISDSANGFISTMKFLRAFDCGGMLAIGTNNGVVKIFRLEKMDLVTEVSGERDGNHVEPQFIMGEAFDVWEQDMLRIDFLELTLSSDKTNIMKGPTMNLLIIKHPNNILSTMLTISLTDIDFKPVVVKEYPDGSIVGISQYSDSEFVIFLENGEFSMLVLQNGCVSTVHNSLTTIRDDCSLNPRETNSFKGMAFSPNKSLLCIGKSLSGMYNHLRIRKPASIVFFTMLPEIDTFEHITDVFSENQFKIIKILDTLLAFRYHLRRTMKTNYDVYLKHYLEDVSGIPVDQLKLYLWILKAMVFNENYNDNSKSSEEIEDIINRRHDLLEFHLNTEDRILTRHFISLLKKVKENTMLENISEIDSQSLCAIQTYLKSKSKKPTLNIRVDEGNKPRCPICTAEVSFQPTSPLDNFRGISWQSLTCEENHRFPICVLSLLPCDVPYRTCDSCKVTALITPVFNQPPICPFCGDSMLPTCIWQDNVDCSNLESTLSEENEDGEDEKQSD